MFKRFIKSHTTHLVATAVVSAGLSGGGVYFFLEKKLNAKYAEISEQEIEKAKNYYKAVQEKPDPEELAAKYSENEEDADPPLEKAIQALKEYAGEDGKLDPRIPEEKVSYSRNVFVDNSEWDIDVEMSKRDPNSVEPFIISEEEFFENELDHEQLQLTYFEEDDILSDGKESPVENRDYVVGFGTLDRFGHGSNNKDIVYVRNRRLDSDIEIIRDQRSFAEVVHGIIQHSDYKKHKVRKFRTFDE